MLIPAVTPAITSLQRSGTTWHLAWQTVGLSAGGRLSRGNVSGRGPRAAAAVIVCVVDQSAADRDLARRLRSLLSSQPLGVLATLLDGAPHQSLMAFVASEDLKEIYFASYADTRKVVALSRDRQAAFLVASRTDPGTEFQAASAVMASGTAEPLSADEARAVLPLYLQRHAQMRLFVSSPSCLMFRMRVERYRLVSGVDEVRDLAPPG